MTKRTITAIAACAFLIAIAFAAGRLSAPDPFHATVKRIRATPQTRDGEIIDNLTILGREAVPAIGLALADETEFPMTYVLALARLGDPRGAPPILAFIERLAPYDDLDDRHLTAYAISGLKGTRNPDACPPLKSIFDDVTTQLYVRLASAGALASLCPEDADDERAFILREFRNSIGQPMNPEAPRSELYAALIDVDTEESRAILFDVMYSEQPMNYIVKPVVAYFATKRGDDVEAALTAVLDNPLIDDLWIRLDAARALLEMNGPSPELAGKTRGLLDLAREYRWHGDDIWEVERVYLRANGNF